MLIRTATVTASLAIAANHQREQLAALYYVPDGARVAAMVWSPCRAWELRRSDHLPSMVIVRRHGFSNDQWPLVGASLLTVNYRPARLFAMDPSQIVRDEGCRNEGRPIAEAFRLLPTAAFDYLWLLDVPAVPPGLTAGWQPVFVAPGSILFRRIGAGGAEPRPATPQPATGFAR